MLYAYEKNLASLKLFEVLELKCKTFAPTYSCLHSTSQITSYLVCILLLQRILPPQALIVFVGVASGLILCGVGVSDGRLTVGDAVLFLTLIGQLYSPLNWLGGYYRTIQNQMVDQENLFEVRLYVYGALLYIYGALLFKHHT